MAWWSWCIFGMVLLGVELLAVDAQFYLVFAGLAAIVVGLLGLVGLELPVVGAVAVVRGAGRRGDVHAAPADLREAHEQAVRQRRHRPRSARRR